MKTSRLPDKIVQTLRKEAVAWDRARTRSSTKTVTADLERAEVFTMISPHYSRRLGLTVRRDASGKGAAGHKGPPYGRRGVSFS